MRYKNIFPIIGSFLLILFYSCSLFTPQPEFTSEERAWLEEHSGELSVLFGFEVPPYAFYDEEGRYQGFYVDIFRELEKILGYSIEMVMFDSWAEMIEYAQTEENYLIVGIADTPSRRKYMSFTDSFSQLPYVLICRQSNQIRNLDGIEHIKVGTVEQYAVNEFLLENHPNIELLTYRNNVEVLRAVSTGECDVMVANQMYATSLIESEGLSNLVITGKSGYTVHLSLGVSRQNDVLYRVMEKSLAMIDEKKKDDLYRKWVGMGSVWLSQRFRDILIISGVATAILFVLMWVWLLFLRREVAKQTDQIRENEKELLRTERIKSLGVLAGGIAHDFNNLLTGVYGYLELAMNETDRDSVIFSYLKEANDSMNRATLLTSQLLSLTSKKEPVFAVLDLSEIVEKVVKFLFFQSQTTAEIHVSRSLWKIKGDRGQLDQVITNLAINGSQAMDGEGTLSITLINEKGKDGKFVRLDVKDRGKGIEEKILPHIFDPYFTTKEMGNGLGLASSFSIVQKHGGSLSVKSELGHGSVFTICLPAYTGN
jgi:signal transduction histidine kinase